MHLSYKKEENGLDHSLFVTNKIDFLLISVQIVSKIYRFFPPDTRIPEGIWNHEGSIKEFSSVLTLG